MQIVPMRELKNTVEIERRCAEENGPVFVTKNGYGRRFTRKAASDVTGIVDYLAGELENPSAAAAFKKKLQECMETLRQFPQSESFVRNTYLPAWNVRWKPVGRYLLLYRVKGEERMIEALRVVYGKQNMEDVMQNLSN